LNKDKTNLAQRGEARLEVGLARGCGVIKRSTVHENERNLASLKELLASSKELVTKKYYLYLFL
jgi:hypothetical protein